MKKEELVKHCDYKNSLSGRRHDEFPYSRSSKFLVDEKFALAGPQIHDPEHTTIPPPHESEGAVTRDLHLINSVWDPQPPLLLSLLNDEFPLLIPAQETVRNAARTPTTLRMLDPSDLPAL